MIALLLVVFLPLLLLLVDPASVSLFLLVAVALTVCEKARFIPLAALLWGGAFALSVL